MLHHETGCGALARGGDSTWAGAVQVIRPAKLWCDVESAAEAEELSRLFGSTLVPSFTGGGGC